VRVDQGLSRKEVSKCDATKLGTLSNLFNRMSAEDMTKKDQQSFRVRILTSCIRVSYCWEVIANLIPLNPYALE